MALTSCCLFVTLSELWSGQQSPAGAFLLTNKVEIKSREEGQRRRGEQRGSQAGVEANESSGVLTMGRLCLR